LTSANHRDLFAVSARLDIRRRDNNSFLLVEALPPGHFWQAFTQRPREVVEVPIVGQMWPYLAGPSIPLGYATGLGLLGFLLAVTGTSLVAQRKTSSPCHRCGMARDPDDVDITEGHPDCLLCYQTFVGGVSLDFGTKRAAKQLLSSRAGTQDMMRRLGAALMPGAGHSLAGHAVLGFTLSLLTMLGALILYAPQGIWRGPVDLMGLDWTGITTLGLPLLIAGVLPSLIAAARGISAVQLDERGKV
jgi:hypothetical protein